MTLTERLLLLVACFSCLQVFLTYGLLMVIGTRL